MWGGERCVKGVVMGVGRGGDGVGRGEVCQGGGGDGGGGEGR